jgi:hypothetical protein
MDTDKTSLPQSTPNAQNPRVILPGQQQISTPSTPLPNSQQQPSSSTGSTTGSSSTATNQPDANQPGVQPKILGQPGPGGTVSRRDQILQAKEKVAKLKIFIAMKSKINQLISFKKFEEAKQTYSSMYGVYQQLLRLSTEQEAARLHKDVSDIYAELIDAMTRKGIKKAAVLHDKNAEREEELKKKQQMARKIVTTDFDVIMQVIEEKGKMTLAEIETRFGVSRNLAEEWIQILADYKLVDLRYLPVGGIEITKIKT